jgi:phage shock protein C
MKNKELRRDPANGYLGGVCAGIAEYTGTSPLIWRILAVFATNLPLVYLILWATLKEKDYGQ